jgi:hypothetical protein
MSYTPPTPPEGADEKRHIGGYVSDFAPPSSEEQGLNLVRDWTDDEERRAKRK